MWTAIAAVAGLLTAVFVWWIKQDDQHEKEKIEIKKKADNAKTSSDITSVFDDINHRM
jgi:predicted histidine transporter YuiF (NhaC family)